MISRKKLFLGTAVLGFSLSHSIAGLAQGEERPELTGTWTNASRTSLSRPRGVEDLVVSAEQAAQLVSGMGLAGISAENIENGPAVDPETGARLRVRRILVCAAITYSGPIRALLWPS